MVALKPYISSFSDNYDLKLHICFIHRLSATYLNHFPLINGVLMTNIFPYENCDQFIVEIK